MYSKNVLKIKNFNKRCFEFVFYYPGTNFFQYFLRRLPAGVAANRHSGVGLPTEHDDYE